MAGLGIILPAMLSRSILSNSTPRSLSAQPVVKTGCTACRSSPQVRRRSVQVAAMAKPVITYYPIRGRAEVMRLTFAAAKVEFDHVEVDKQVMKEDIDQFPFGQCPRLVDGDVDLVQSNTILRYLAQKHGLSVKGLQEQLLVDMIIEGVESLRLKYVGLIYGSQLAEDAKAKYWDTHLSKASRTGKNGGAHFEYLAHLVEKHGKDGFAVGSGLTMADLAVYEISDLHLRIYADKFAAEYPALKAHHTKVAGLPGIKEYLASDKCYPRPNNNQLG